MRTRSELFAPRRIARAGGVRRYSRFVAVTKYALPVTAGVLLALVAAWPQLDTVFTTVHLAIPRIDLTEARDLRMVKARYSGIDRENRPFVITADVARQKPKLDNLITLEQPKGDLTETSGSWLELSANTGLYQPQPQLLDLFGNVSLFQDKGNEFHSTSAHVDMNAGSAVGDDPVSGQGAFGSITADGFRILDHGSTIIFTGHAKLDLLPRSGASR